METAAHQTDGVFYKSLFDNLLDGLAYCKMLFDTHGQPVDFLYIRVNKNFEKLTGLKNAEGKKVTELIPGIRTSNPELFKVYGRVSLTGEPESFEIYIEPLLRWFFVRAYSAEKNFFVAVFQNITARKTIEKKLENAKIAARNVLEDLQTEKDELAYAKAKDEAMLAGIGDGVIVANPDGTIKLMNLAAQKMLGWKNIGVVGKSLFDLVSIENEKGEPVTEADRPMAVALSMGTSTFTTTTTEKREAVRTTFEKKIISGTYYYVRKDKTKFPAAITVTPVILKNAIVGVIEVFRDITIEKEIDKAKSEFVSLASHQLRSPVTAIKWYAEMLLSGDAGPLNERQKDYFDVIYHNNQKMVDLIDALLNVSRLELGAFAVEPESTGIAEVMRSVIEEQKVAIGQKEISLTMAFANAAPLIPADKKLLRMVVSNILSNAIKYTPSRGSIECTVGTVRGGESVGGKKMAVDSVVITIADTGYGIPAFQQDKIFTKLFRADNVKKMNAEGTGLGLYIVKAIIDRSGGLVWFESTENKGTTFYVAIPLTGMKKT